MDQLGLHLPAAEPLALGALLVSLAIGFALALALRWHFERFASTLSNRSEFAQVFPFVVLTTVLIITVVKSSLALSLGLVGALSIVRFRTAIKDPRDVGFVFASLAVGMAAGTGFYAAAVVFTAFLCILLLVLGRLNVGAASSTDAMVRVTFGSGRGDDAVATVEAALRSADAQPVLVNRLHERESDRQTLSWRVRTGEGAEQGQLQAMLQRIEGVAAVGLYVLDDFHVL